MKKLKFIDENKLIRSYFLRKILRFFYSKKWTGDKKAIMQIYFFKHGVTIMTVSCSNNDIWAANKSKKKTG